MRRFQSLAFWCAVAIVGGLGVTPVNAQEAGCCRGMHGQQPGGGRHGRPHGGGRHGDPSHQADREIFHFLLEHRADIRRTVTPLPNGVETLTESDDPTVVAKLQTHVQAMARRVEEQRPIHRRDPLFAEIFRHADKIKMQLTPTPQGLKVLETSDDPYVVQLIQAHAEVVNLFVKNGWSEMRKDHPLPVRQ